MLRRRRWKGITVSRSTRAKATSPPNGSNLKVGDTVRADAKSAGYLVYPDGCRVKVAPGSVSTVRANSPCSFKAQVGGDDGGFGTEWVVGGLLGAGVIGGGIFAATQGGGGNGGNSGFGGGTGVLPVEPPLRPTSP